VAPETFYIAGLVDSACGKKCISMSDFPCIIHVFPCRTHQRVNIIWRYCFDQSRHLSEPGVVDLEHDWL